MEVEAENMASAMWIMTVTGDHFEQEVERPSSPCIEYSRQREAGKRLVGRIGALVESKFSASLVDPLSSWQHTNTNFIHSLVFWGYQLHWLYWLQKNPLLNQLKDKIVQLEPTFRVGGVKCKHIPVAFLDTASSSSVFPTCQPTRDAKAGNWNHSPGQRDSM